MVPEEYVDESQYNGKAIIVRSASGHRKAKRMDTVQLTVGGHSFSTIAATCPGKELGGVALLAIDICNPKDLSLFTDLAGRIKARVQANSMSLDENISVSCVSENLPDVEPVLSSAISDHVSDTTSDSDIGVVHLMLTRKVLPKAL